MIKIIIYLLILAITHAKLELMTEGKRMGWAGNLPCWKQRNFLTDWILGKKPLTGYHVWLLIIFFIIFHSPYLFIEFTLKKELIILGLFCWYWVIEDFSWFILNPLFRFRNFKKGKIYWHGRWFFKLPYSYWCGIIIGTTFLLLGGLK